MDSVAALLQSLAERNESEAITAILREGSQSVSAGELARQARCFASGLLQHDHSRGDRVAFVAETSPSLIVALLGTMASGCIAVPIDVQLKSQTAR